MNIPSNYTDLLRQDVQQFLKTHLKADVAKTILNLPKDLQALKLEIGNQLKSIQKATDKIPLYTQTEGVIFPPSLSVEQASSTETALYKASLVEGSILVDLTGGMGVDSLHFAQRIEQVIYVEQNELLAEIARHNFEKLGIKNIQGVHQKAEDFLAAAKKQNKQFDWIYADPARRDDAKRKVVLLTDCVPNIVEIWKEFASLSQNWLVKAAPLLDIRLASTQLPSMRKVHVVALENECKELLFELDELASIENRFQEKNLIITTINLSKTKPAQTFTFLSQQEKNLQLNYLEQIKLENYIYEPNAALMKAGAFKVIAHFFNIQKIDLNTHLYTSGELLKDFPGRVFEVLETMPFSPKKIQKRFGGKKYNVFTRNFPKAVRTIRQQFGIEEGGEEFLLFTLLYPRGRAVVRLKRIQ